MRIKAQNSLEKLRQMKRKKYTSFSQVDTETWHQVKCRKHYGVNYLAVVAWVSENTTGFHSRSDESFWFDNEKDAFKFRLAWGGDKDGDE